MSSSMIRGRFDLSGNADLIQFSGSRRIHDEYRYCLDRQSQPKRNGNGLDKPSFLVKPLERGGTTIHIQNVRGHDNFKRDKMGVMARRCSLDLNGKYGDNSSKRRNAYKMYNVSMEFLQSASKVLSNLVVDEEGFVYIDTKEICVDHKTIWVVAMDEDRSCCKSYSMHGSMDEDVGEEKQSKYKDNRQKMDVVENIDKLTLKQETRSIVLLNRNCQHIIDDFKSTEIAMYNTIKDVYALLTALSKEQNDDKLQSLLKNWSFITTWESFNESQKMKKLSVCLLSSRNCSDLLIFLVVMFFQL